MWLYSMGLLQKIWYQQFNPISMLKGGNYNSEYPPPEVRVAMKYGGEFRVLPYVEGISTTILIDKITRLKERQGEGLDNDLGLQDLSN